MTKKVDEKLALLDKITELQTQCAYLQEQWEKEKAKKQPFAVLQEQIEAKKQRILTLESGQQDLLSQLNQQKKKWNNHLTQEKAQIQQEIQLIKEVLHV